MEIAKSQVQREGPMRPKLDTAVFIRNLPMAMLILTTIGCAEKAASEAAVPWYVDDLSDGQTGSGSADDPFRQLQDAIDAAEDGDTIHILEGTHLAVASEAIDPTCGNCDDALS